jgi:hypothetical protein
MSVSGAKSDRFTIPTLLERNNVVLLAYAYCPVCDKVERSDDQGRGHQHALNASVAKIRAHLRSAHHIV